MWSLVVFDPARPSRNRPARASPVLSRKHSNGVIAERLLPGPRCRFLLGVTDHDGRVDVQDKAADLPPGHGYRREIVAGVGVLGRGDLACPGSGGTQFGGHRLVELRQEPPRGRVGRDWPEQGGLVTQHGQVSDGLAAVGHRHGKVDGDPAGIMPALPLPEQGQGFAECTGQTGRVSEIRE
jgi:hypothetical protein